MDAELEALRKKRMLELMKEQSNAVLEQEQQVKEAFKTIERSIRQHLDNKAYERLNNIKLVNPELAYQATYLLYQLKMAGRLPQKITDEEFKKILTNIMPKKREPKIIRR